MHLLSRHPHTPPGAIHTVEAELCRVQGGAVATFRATGDISRLVIPPPAVPERSNDLWRSTCFELFVADGAKAYREFNLSPSGAWAAYQFDGHRSGMVQAQASVEIEISMNDKTLSLIAKIESEFLNPSRVGLTAVIEEGDGIIRYWATAFAPGEPDFHAEATRSLLFDGVSAE
ncbi:MAG TPA: DOMON-like domain-containing protein [Sphingomicrobium sp.]|nr:DOMON-like domain-containing protein [Sphingomicrobium sp.]